MIDCSVEYASSKTLESAVRANRGVLFQIKSKTGLPYPQSKQYATGTNYSRSNIILSHHAGRKITQSTPDPLDFSLSYHLNHLSSKHIRGK